MENENGWAYNCLPLKISNQYGWTAYSPYSFSATWDGNSNTNSLIILDENGKECEDIKSHFAQGLLTIITDFIIQTPQGISLYVRGETNSQKDLIYPLDGIIETDWLPFYFTFNFRFLKPGTVTFKKGEPLFMFFPIIRNFIDNFEIFYKDINDNKELNEQFIDFNESRTIRNKNSNKYKLGAQKFYLRGFVTDNKIDIKNHQISINLKVPKEIK
jgi:hypothetical protein